MVVRQPNPSEKKKPHFIGVRSGWRYSKTPLAAQLISITPDDLKTHALIIGATGSGKTVLLHHLIAQEIIEGRSFIVFDMRGDLVSSTLAMCQGHVDPGRVALFDLREKERPLGFNPLAGHGEPYFRALGVLDVVREASESWGVQLDETLRSALLLLAETGQTLTELDPLFYDAAYRNRLLEGCTSDAVISFWERYGELSREKQSNMSMPVMNKLSMLLSAQALIRTLGHQAPLDLRRHLDTPGSVTLVSLAVDELHSAGEMLGGMLLASICREVFARVHLPEEQRNPIRLYVDEFEHFGMREFENILAEGRRFGLHLVLAHQTTAQLSTKMRSLILGNVGVKAVFRSSWQDASVLSKDLTGDPKGLDLANLTVGRCALWKKGCGTTLVEVNRPLVTSGDADTPEVKEYIEAIQSRTPIFTGTRLMRTRTVKLGSDADATPPKTTVVPPKEDLEDWLCG
jgi:hypothetical protein